MSAYLMKPVRRSSLMDALMNALVGPPSVPTGSPVNVQGSVGARRQFTAKVLLVEDNYVNRRVAVGLLKKLRCEITEAENGRVAVETLALKSFDVVFMDVQMPVMDGFEATRQIKADGRWPGLPIIAMTAHAMKGDRERCLDAGMDDYITKPVQLPCLEEILMRWLPDRQGCANSPQGAAPPKSSGPVRGEHRSRPIDVEKALEALGGDLELMRDVIRAFVDTLPALFADIQSACASSDSNRLREAAHSLKGSSSNICAEPVREAAERLELIGKRGAAHEASATLPQLEGHLDQLKAFAAAWLNESR